MALVGIFPPLETNDRKYHHHLRYVFFSLVDNVDLFLFFPILSIFIYLFLFFHRPIAPASNSGISMELKDDAQHPSKANPTKAEIVAERRKARAMKVIESSNATKCCSLTRLWILIDARC